MPTYLVIKRANEDRVYMPGEVIRNDPSWAAILVQRGYLSIVPDNYESATTDPEPSTDEESNDPTAVTVGELMALSRADLNQLAVTAGVENPEALPNKQAVADAIVAAQEPDEVTEEEGDDDTDAEDEGEHPDSEATDVGAPG